MRDDFAVFILTHGRAKQQVTLETLKRCGYSGRVYLVIDDQDEQGPTYRRLYGDKVITFSKAEVGKRFDTMTNAKEYRSVVYARNACYTIAAKAGCRYMFTCDDDISGFQFRVVKDGKLKGFKINAIDRLFDAMCDLMEQGRVAIFGFSQAGAYVGGAESKKYQDGCQRMVSQAMCFDVCNPVQIRGIFNEDLHMGFDAGIAGQVALSTMLVSIQSPKRTSNAGGLHDLYMDNNVYVRDFYSFMAFPGIVTLSAKDDGIHLTIHHNNDVPKILNEKHQKGLMAG